MLLSPPLHTPPAGDPAPSGYVSQAANSVPTGTYGAYTSCENQVGNMNAAINSSKNKCDLGSCGGFVVYYDPSSNPNYYACFFSSAAFATMASTGVNACAYVLSQAG